MYCCYLVLFVHKMGIVYIGVLCYTFRDYCLFIQNC